jgi:hypothetical protein
MVGTQNGDGHEHDHDTHYHGEPSRVLDDRALPEAVALYGSNPETGVSGAGVKRWIDQLEGVEEISRIYTAQVAKGDAPTLEVRRVDARNLNFLEEGFEGFPESLRNEVSVLFLPVELTVNPTTWKDLRSNDVTVNWLTVDTNPENSEPHPKVIVLSDWITAVGHDVPEARSTGVTPGIFHLTNDSFGDFEKLCATESSLPGVFESFLDDPSRKLRPCFLHEREWNLG